MQIKIDSIQLEGRKPRELPKEITLNEEVSWMIGFWVGDNWSSRYGTTIRSGKRSSGRFGVNNNDEGLIKKFLEGLRNELKITRFKIDVQIPQNWKLDKEKIRKDTSKKFEIESENINVYFGSPWRKHIGYVVYTNNTALLRIITNEIYKKLWKIVQSDEIDIKAFMQGIVDSEGDVDKANKNVGITNKDAYVVQLIIACLKRLSLQFKKIVDQRKRTMIEIKNIKKFKEKISFSSIRKQMALNEMLAGNFMREKDKEYLKKFEKELKKGVSALEIHKKLGIPHSTVKLVLKNLTSGKLVKRKKVGKKYVYYLP